MKLYLCVDGGGTKTRSVISDESGEILSSGEAGPSNLTFGVEQTVAAITSSTRKALASLPSSSQTASHQHWPPTSSDATTGSSNPPLFAKVWVGIAGCARPPDHGLLSPFVAGLFPGSHWKLSGDGDLLTSPAIHSDFNQVITIICGTGSLALRWSRLSDGSLAQVERSGGWGPLLGDEGSGWSMGREGVKSVLTFTANGRELRPFHRQIMDRLGVDDPHRVLASLKLPDENEVVPSQAEVARKGRIAGCTKHIVPAALEGDDEALRILHKVAAEVMEVVRPLEETLAGQGGGGHDHTDTMLVFGGGLSGVNEFRQAVLQKMTAEGWIWGDVRVVSNAAEEGVRTLIEEASGKAKD